MSLFANYRWQFLLDRLGKCLKLFVSTEGTSSHEFAYQFDLAIFYTRKTPNHLAETVSPARTFIWMNRRQAIDRQRSVEKGR